jgi:protein ImuA
MTAAKADIISALRKDILSLQGIRYDGNNSRLDKTIGIIKNAFPDKTFPVGAMHEFITSSPEDVAVTNAFVASIVNPLMVDCGPVIWVGNNTSVFPPALKAFGIAPEKIIFIELKKEKEMLWVIEEALKCEGLAAVIGEIKELSFTQSRRLQLAVEKSKVTGFIIRNNPRAINITACVTRWKITSLPGENTDDLPGVSFPKWNVNLLKVRNGKPATWQIEYNAGRFRHNNKIAAIPQELQQKTG